MAEGYDTDFRDAQWQALNGDATAMAAILRDPYRSLNDGERDTLAMMIERLAEHARGDIGGKAGQPHKDAGHPDVRRAVDRYDQLRAESRQKTEAKKLVAKELGISPRTVDGYLKLRREREALIAQYERG